MMLTISKGHRIFLSLLLGIPFFSRKKISRKTQPIAYSSSAAFDWFDYKGKDQVYKNISNKENEYLNPILAGFYPDPSICVANGKFYLINSSFTFSPGLPIFESVDLVNLSTKESKGFVGTHLAMYASDTHFDVKMN